MSLIGHLWLAWGAHLSEQEMHGEAPRLADVLREVGRDTLQNRPSEFLRRIWQAAGFALLSNVGSPQSREVDDRPEERTDTISPERADRIIAEPDDRSDRGHPSA